MAKFYTSVAKRGNSILLVEYNNGIRDILKIKYEPTVFLPHKDGEWKTLVGSYPMKEFHPGTIKETQEFVEANSAENYKILHNDDFVAQFIADRYKNGCLAAFDMSVINVMGIDIECKSNEGFPDPVKAEQPITAITIKIANHKRFMSWGIGDYTPADNVNYTQCEDERDLLLKFWHYYAKNIPDILTGWNVEFFDLPYIVHRIAIILGKDYLKGMSLFNLSPFRKEHKNGDVSYVFNGTTVMDYLPIFKKFGYTFGPQENYKLDTIAFAVLSEKKLDYSEYASLHDLYLKNHQKFMEYNVRDTGLVMQMEEKAGLLEVALTLAYKANATYDSTFGTVRIWETFIYNVLKRKKIVDNPKSNRFRTIEGGYVKDVRVGMTEWVMSFDLNSLYPHLMMQYNMSPETVRDRIPGITPNSVMNGEVPFLPGNVCIAANGQTFDISKKGFIPEIVETLYDERSIIKKKALEAKQQKEDHPEQAEKFDKQIAHFDNEQMAIKILMNSLYGAVASKHFRYFDADVAEAITLSGQATIRIAERTVNNLMNTILETEDDYIIAIDTDSIYVNVQAVLDLFGDDLDTDQKVKALDLFAKNKIEPALKESFEVLRSMMNCREQKMMMGREKIARRMLFVAKKKYMAHVIDDEGVRYTTPKLKITGIQAVQSSTPMFCRDLIKQGLELIMTEDESTIQKFIAEHKDEFMALRPEEVAFPRGVHNIGKYMDGGYTYTKGTPIHVRGSILYNAHLAGLGIKNKYEPIRDDDKIKFCYLKMPNPLRENVIAFPVILPPEFELENYIDYELQYQKTFIVPMQIILTAIGWSVERRSTLESFFG